MLLKGTHSGTDGIYTDDPRTNPEATRLDEVDLPRRAQPGPAGHGLHRHHAVHGQRPADRDVRPDGRGQRPGHPRGSPDRYPGPLRDPGRPAIAVASAHRPVARAASPTDQGAVGERRAGRVDPRRRHREDGQGGRAHAGRVRRRSAPVGPRRRWSRRSSVEYYGTEMPLQQLAGFQVPEARQLLITPYDKSSMGAIEKAIQQLRPGAQPEQRRRRRSGSASRRSPTERRKELVKVVRGMAEDGEGRAAQPAPRRPPRARRAREGRRPVRATSWPGPRRSSTGSSTRTRPTSTRRSRPRNRSCSED